MKNRQRPAALLLALFLAGFAAPLPARAGENKALTEPKALFDKACASCHSKDGKAQPPAARKLGVKDLSQSKLTDPQIIQQITAGRQENQTASKMPAFKEKLTPAEIESLVPVVKGFRK